MFLAHLSGGGEDGAVGEPNLISAARGRVEGSTWGGVAALVRVGAVVVGECWASAVSNGGADYCGKMHGGIPKREAVTETDGIA